MMELADDALECDFALNDGNVTVVVGQLDGGKQDGSDSGVELNGADTAVDTPVDTPVALPLDFDATSEGGSESSSVLSATPVRKRTSASSSSSTPSCSSARQGTVGTPSTPLGHGHSPHARSRSVAASDPASTSSSSSGSTPVPAPRDRSAAARGSSCSRGRQAGTDSTRTPSRTSRSQRSCSGTMSASATSGLMTSSMTASMTGIMTASAGNVRGRGASTSACRAPSSSTTPSSTPRPAPRGAFTSTAASASVSTDDGRWPSTVQRPSTLSRTRASSVAAVAEPRRQGLTNSSSKNSVNSTNSASTPSPTVESKCEKFSTLPRRRRRRSVENVTNDKTSTLQPSRKLKVKLYHETCVQTALTSQDLDDILCGKDCHVRPIDAKEQAHQSVQVDRDREDIATSMLDRRLKAIVEVLGFEHTGSSSSPNGSITSTVQSPPHDHIVWIKTLEILEQRACAIKRRDTMQRNEIGRLRYEVEHTERLRKRLQSQHEEAEAETLELQEFMQVEKAMLAESLKEAEKEIAAQRKISQGLREDLERQREECQHLVRVSEQRRQEVLTLEARIAGLELRSRESLLRQGAAVTGASVALSALSSRLDDFACVLEESSVDKALSALVNEAEAVTTRTKEACRPLSLNIESSFQILDNETEPDLEEEGGGGLRENTNNENEESNRLVNSESIQNLSAAILFRRRQEEAISSEANLGNDDSPAHLIDQVLDVDSLITRVLQAIREAVHSKKLPSDLEEGSSSTCNGSISKKMESNGFHRIEDQVEAAKPSHIPLLNVSSEGSCNDTSSINVNGIARTSEPVTGAA